MYLIELLVNKAEQLEWEELYDVVDEACKILGKAPDKGIGSEQVTDGYITALGFLLRLWLKVRKQDAVSELSRAFDDVHMSDRGFCIYNYSLKWLLFTKKRGGEVTDRCLVIPKEKFSKEELERILKLVPKDEQH